MTAARLILWIAITAVFAVPVFFQDRWLRKKGSVLANVLIFQLKVIALPLLGLLLIYWDTVFSWQLNLVVAGLYAVLFGSVITDNFRILGGIITLIARKAGKRKLLKNPDAPQHVRVDAPQRAQADAPQFAQADAADLRENAQDCQAQNTAKESIQRQDTGTGTPVKGSGSSAVLTWLRENLGFRSRLRTEIIFVAAAFLYGTANMMIVTPRTWNVTSSKLENNYKIVWVSDIHTGSVQPVSVIEKTLSDIQAEAPDLLVLGGDITDEYSTKEEAEWVWEKIGSLGIPTVFVWGNHDRQQLSHLAGGRTYTEEEIREIIEKNGVRILEEEYLVLGPDLVLYGREDLSRPSKRKGDFASENPEPDAYCVLLDHQQLDGANVQDYGADLQLSGHSHGGQYFPLNLVYTLAKAYPEGWYQFGDSAMIVSSGEGGWKSPFRTQGHCNFEVISLGPSGK